MSKIIQKFLLLSIMLVFMFCCMGCANTVPSSDSEKKDSQEIVEQNTETENDSKTEKNINLLTGMPTLTDEAIGKRPVAVMVNNVKAAFPQYGIAQADIIFEIPVEGGATRFMAMYGDYTQVPKICSVRSCRMYFPEISEGFDAIYVNWGMADIIRPYIDSLNLTHYEGAYNTGNLFARDADRQAAGYALEHTGYFDGTGLPKAMADANQRTDIEEDKRDTAFKFNDSNEMVTPVGDVCTVAEIDYGAAVATFTYDEETKTYFKQHNGSEQIDGVTGTQLSFTNVIILEANIGAHENQIHRDVRWQEGGNGYYISDGVVQKITWTKVDIESRIQLFDSDGEELSINAGKSYIGINYIGQSIFE